MKIQYSPESRRDLIKIREYITESSSIKTAKATTGKITKSCSLLSTDPFMGVTTEERYDIVTDMRILISGQYLIFYQVQDSSINIIRIFDSRMDIMFRMFGIDESTDDI